MSRFELRLLGTPGVLLDGSRVALPSRKALILLARLATARGCTAGRAEAASFLWPDARPDKARASLRQSLARLRHTFGPEAILGDAQTVSLAPSRWWIDVLDLPATLAGEHPPGEFMAGEYFGEPQIDLWLDEERRHHRERCLAALRAKRDTYKDGDPQQRIDCCHAILTLDAYDEATHRDLMQALAALGHVGRAIKQYEALEALLRDGLDVAPATETRELVRDLRARRSTTAPSPSADRTGPDRLVAMRLVTVISIFLQDAGAAASALRTLAGQLGSVIQEGEPTRCILGLDGSGEGMALSALAALWPHRDEARIGAGCGVVLVGEGDRAQPRGAVIGEADMMALLAAPSEVLVSEALWRQLGEGARGTPVDIRSRKAWSLTRLEAGPSRAAPPFVGRQSECAQVVTLLSRLDAGDGGTLIVQGAPGIGKTRLLDEALQATSRHGYFVATTGFEAFGDDATAFRQRLARALAALFQTPPEPQDMPLHLRRSTRALLGAPVTTDAGTDLAQDQALSRDVLLELMRRLTAERPLVVRIEDTHWARPAQIGYLAALITEAAALPVAFLITERPTHTGLAAALEGSSPDAPAVVLSLSPLGPQDARTLLCRDDNDRKVSAEIVAKANGNPLFLTQLSTASVGDAPLPASLIALVQEQLDHQPAEVTAACHRAAILGYRFPTAGFADVFPETPLADLVRSSFVTIRGTDAEFTHALIQEAIYAMIPVDRRPALHGAAAEVFRTHNAVLWAEHALRAAHDGAAARASLAAAEHLVSQRSLTAAARFIEAGLNCEGEATTRARLLICRADIKRELGESRDALKDYAAAVPLAGDSDLEVRLALKMWATRKFLGEFAHARDHLKVAVDRAAAVELSPETRSELAQELGDAAFQDGDGEACLSHNSAAHDIAREAGLIAHQVRALGGIGDAHYARLNADAALTSFTECVALAAAHELDGLATGHRPMVAISRLYVEAGTAPLEDAAMAAENARLTHSVRSEILALCAMTEIQAFAADARGICDSTRRMAALFAEGPNRFRRDYELSCAFRDWLSGEPGKALERAERFVADNHDPYIAPEMAGLVAMLAPTLERAAAAIETGRAILATGAVAHSYFGFHHFAMRAATRWGLRNLALELADAFAARIDLSRHRFARLAHAQTVSALDGSDADRRALSDEIRAANLALFVHEVA